MLTVQDLIAIEPLKLQAVAGLSGTGRLITWAHTVDLVDPWRWVSPGDLVMTTGIGLPRDEDEQVIWLENLVKSNASALVVAPHQDAPPLSQELLAAADRLMFPLLLASFELEFVKLSHSVIESVLQAQRDRFNASERLFHTYSDALRREPEMSGRLAILSKKLGLDLSVEDTITGLTIVDGGISGGLDRKNAERIAIGARTQANLVICRKQNSSTDDSLLVRSLVGLLGVELEREMIQRDNKRDEGREIFRNLLESEIELAISRPLLERRGLTGTLIALAIQVRENGPRSLEHIHHAPALHHSPPLLLSDEDLLLMIARDDQAFVRVLLGNLGNGTRIGTSGPITAATGYREAVRQARLALTQATELDVDCLRYGERDTGLIMAPKSLEEARALVARYLGPLIEYDLVQKASLMPTLLRFLENDCNWKATSLDLGIHRQTLVYRIKLIEQLSGFRPTTTQGIARFWIAIQAGRNSKLLEHY